MLFSYSMTKTLKNRDDSDDTDNKPEVAGVISWLDFVMTRSAESDDRGLTGAWAGFWGGNGLALISFGAERLTAFPPPVHRSAKKAHGRDHVTAVGFSFSVGYRPFNHSIMAFLPTLV